MFMLIVSIHHCYGASSKQTDGREKNNFTANCTDKSAIFEDSVRGVIAVADVKINKMVESGSPGFGVNEVGFLLFSSTTVAFLVMG